MSKGGFNLGTRKDKSKSAEVATALFEQEYKSTFNYSFFDVESEKEELIECERAIKCNIVAAFKNIGEVAFYLATAKDKMTNGNKGTFMAWYLNLGLSKDFVSFTLMKYNLAVAYNQDVGKVMSLTNEMIKRMVGRNSLMTQNEIEYIVASDDVKEAYRDIIKSKSEPKHIELNVPNYHKSTLALLRLDDKKMGTLKPNQLNKANNYLLKIEEAYDKLIKILGD